VRTHWAAIALIIVLGLGVYANSLNSPFIWDDTNLVVGNPYIKDIRLVKNLFTKDLAYGTQFSNFYRPLQSLTFELDYYLWGLNPFGFHLSNTLWHIGCALAVYFFFSLILPGTRSIPLITALLFVAHPIQTEAVTYISGRADSMVGLFMLLSMIFYIKHSRLARPGYLAGSVLCFIPALLSKETGLILPFLILLYDVSFSHEDLRFRDKLKSRYWLFLAVALIYFLLRSTVLNFIDRPLFLSDVALGLRLLTTAKTFAIYLGLLFLPLHLHMERSVPYVSSLMDKGVLPSLVLLLFIAILIARSYKYSRLCFFAGMWFFLNLLPVSNLVPLNANMAEHWLYLPSLGLFLLIGLGFDKAAKRAKPLKILAVTLLIAALGFYSFLTVRRNREWADAETFFRSILRYSPHSAEAYNCLGAIYQNRREFGRAADEFKEAIKAGPNNYKSYGNLGAALRRQGRLDLAISAYRKALKLRPDIPGLYNNLGNTYADRRDWSEAKQAFGKALQLYPEFALCRVNLGKLYYATGQVNLAIEEYKKAIALRPDLKIAHYYLAIAHQSRKKIQDK